MDIENILSVIVALKNGTLGFKKRNIRFADLN